MCYRCISNGRSLTFGCTYFVPELTPALLQGGMNPMMMGMNPMMMGGGPGMGGPMGPVPPKRGPVPPPKPPPRSPPGGGGRSAEEEFMQMMMKMRGRSEAGLPSGRAQEEVMMRAYENMRRGGRSPRRDRRYRCFPKTPFWPVPIS